MKVSQSILLIFLFFSFANANNQLFKVHYLCNYDYQTFWSGHPILIGNVLRKMNELKRCATFKKNDISTTTESTIGSTSASIMTTTSSTTTTTLTTLPKRKPKLPQKNMKKVCRMIFRAMPKMSLNNMMKFRQFYQPIRKCTYSYVSI